MYAHSSDSVLTGQCHCILVSNGSRTFFRTRNTVIVEIATVPGNNVVRLMNGKKKKNANTDDEFDIYATAPRL